MRDPKNPGSPLIQARCTSTIRPAVPHGRG
jgi:hypothetical protein